MYTFNFHLHVQRCRGAEVQDVQVQRFRYNTSIYDVGTNPSGMGSRWEGCSLLTLKEKK